jgi:glutathione peroxidase
MVSVRGLFVVILASSSFFLFANTQPKGKTTMQSIYTFKVTGLNGKEVNLSAYKDKVLLIVNTASRCGYTPQFKALQQLHSEFASKGLVVIGVPSNDFKQELESSEKIGEFCKLNYGVDFQMLASMSVTGDKKSDLFKFLVANGPAPKAEVKWNFEKFLVDSNGAVVARMSSSESPDSPEFKKQILALLPR